MLYNQQGARLDTIDDRGDFLMSIGPATVEQEAVLVGRPIAGIATVDLNGSDAGVVFRPRPSLP
jgi:hypothetical protein